MISANTFFHTAPKIMLALAAALSAAACTRSPSHTGSIPESPIEYRDRHPIVLTQAEHGIDIFTVGNGRVLDARQRKELTQFTQDYRTSGRGPMRVLVPVGDDGRTAGGAGAVRAALRGTGQIHQTTYRVPGPAQDQPIRVAFTKLKAQTATKCGQWPDDLANSDMRKNWNNTSYYNFGCAYQNMLAQQVADPLDLVRAQPEAPIDTQRRIAVITAQRGGEDSSTEYRATETKINSAVGQ